MNDWIFLASYMLCVASIGMGSNIIGKVHKWESDDRFKHNFAEYERFIDEQAQERLLAEAYRILNNHGHICE